MATLIPADPVAHEPVVEDVQVCIPEHCFYAFDTLFCALTKKTPVAAKFPDEK